MINNVYAIKNVLANRYNDIFQYPTDQFAVQRIREIAANHPEAIKLDESELYRVASFEVETGKISGLENPVKIELETTKVPIEGIEKELTNK